METIKSAGAKLANIAYNLAQRKDLPADILASLDATRKEWDEAMRLASQAESVHPSQRSDALPTAKIGDIFALRILATGEGDFRKTESLPSRVPGNVGLLMTTTPDEKYVVVEVVDDGPSSRRLGAISMPDFETRDLVCTYLASPGRAESAPDGESWQHKCEETERALLFWKAKAKLPEVAPAQPVPAATAPQQAEERAHDVAVLLRLRQPLADGSPVHVIITKPRYEELQTVEEVNKHDKFLYEQHTCPTNWLGVEYIIDGQDADPHGVFEHVQTIEIPRDEYGNLIDLGDSNEYGHIDALRGLFSALGTAQPPHKSAAGVPHIERDAVSRVPSWKIQAMAENPDFACATDLPLHIQIQHMKNEISSHRKTAQSSEKGGA